VLIRQWVVSVPVPLRYWMASSQELTAKVHTIIRTTIGQYYVNQVVTRGVPREKVQPGSMTFIQRFGSAINVNVHYHVIFLEGVYLDRTAQGLKPQFITVEPLTDTDIAAVVQKIGAPPARCPWRACLHVHSPVVRQHHRDQTVAIGSARKAGRARAPATPPPGALWGLFGAPQ